MKRAGQGENRPLSVGNRPVLRLLMSYTMASGLAELTKNDRNSDYV